MLGSRVRAPCESPERIQNYGFGSFFCVYGYNNYSYGNKQPTNLTNEYAQKTEESLLNKGKSQHFVKELKRRYRLFSPNSNTPTYIMFAVNIGKGKQVRFSTGVKVYPIHWNGERCKDYNLPYQDLQNNIIANEALNIYDSRFCEFLDSVNNGILKLTKDNILQYVAMNQLWPK